MPSAAARNAQAARRIRRRNKEPDVRPTHRPHPDEAFSQSATFLLRRALRFLTGVYNSISPELVSGQRVLEVGSYNVNGSVRGLITKYRPSEYIGVDLRTCDHQEQQRCVDQIVDACELKTTFGADSFDLVVSTEMLEHIEDWRRAIENLKSVVRPGGTIILTTRSPGFPNHGYPMDFWRFRTEDMASIFCDFEDVFIEKDHSAPGVFVTAVKPLVGEYLNLEHIDVVSVKTPALERLLIGAGPDRRLGWCTLDANPIFHTDFVATVPPLPDAVTRKSWDEIAAIHFIEHLYYWEVKEFVEAVYSVLKPGGRLVSEQPNIEFCAKVILGLETPAESFEHQCGLGGIYGDIRRRDASMGHKWGWTPRTLTDVFVNAGFDRDSISCSNGRYHRADRDFLLLAVK